MSCPVSGTQGQWQRCSLKHTLNWTQAPEAWLVLSHTAGYRQGPLCWLNCRKGSNATCRSLGLTTAAECWQEPASLEHQARNSRWATRNQGEEGSQNHLPAPIGSHVRGRLSARLCGKDARAASIFFHSRHELWPTDRRRQRSHVHPPPTIS